MCCGTILPPFPRETSFHQTGKVKSTAPMTFATLTFPPAYSTHISPTLQGSYLETRSFSYTYHEKLEPLWLAAWKSIDQPK